MSFTSMLGNMLGMGERVVNTVFMIPWVSFLVLNIETFIDITTMMDRTMDRQSVQFQNNEAAFDYIVVGAGSSGCIVAARLSEDPSVRVLLLEAGGEPSIMTNIPSFAYHLQRQRAHDWNHQTVRHMYAGKSLIDGVSNWPAGKVLGGSSVIHGLINIRGNVQGFDLMANRTKDPNWTTANLLTYYQKGETYNGWFKKGTMWHGSKGELSIEAPTLVPLTSYILGAGRELGYKIRDPNGLTYEEGFSPMECYTKNGVRQDVYRSSIKPHLHRTNLVVRKYAFVTRLRFHDGTNRVSGVEYERHGKMYVVKSRKETILSAGALSSPKILMLSGIGPKDHLNEMKIHTRMDLPVGQSLQDTYGGLIGPFIVPKGYSFDVERDANLSSSMNWYMTGKGLLSSARSEATWAIVSKAAPDAFAPDIHTYVLSHTPSKPVTPFGKQFNLNQEWQDYAQKSVKYGDGFFQLATLNRVASMGTAKLRNDDPHSPLVMDPRYLEHPLDVASMIEGLKFAVNLVDNTRTMQSIGAQLFRLPFPGCEGFKFKSDPYYECIGRHATLTAFKYAGTAPLGIEDDKTAVVDSKFRVFGVESLRVIDASVLRLTEVNMNDVTMRAIGELGAAMIKSSWHM